MTLAEALIYQREQDEAKRPFYGNPNLAAQGRNVERQRAFPFTPGNGFLRDPQSYKDMGANLLEMISPPVPTPEEAKAGLGSMRADSQLKGSVMQGYPDAQGLLADQAYDKMGNIAMAGMNVYHGTPHRFLPTKNNPLGEFDPMKSGTGEGAQAYGVGAGYLAESRGVAQSYKDTLGSKTYDGKYYNSNKPEHIAADILEMVGGNKESAIKKLEEDAATMLADGMSRNALASKRAAESIKDGRAAKIDYTGSLYKVDLPDEQIAKMLDWDKPLSQQPDVLKKLNDAGHHVDPTDTGEIFYMNRGGGKWMSDALNKAGIPGIRYLDQGSRSGGAGTSNFVVFDPKHMNIIGRE